MKVKERGAWTAYNEGKGGSKSSFDQFNKSFKGQERNPSASEFASMDVEEYHHYSERAEYKEPQRDFKGQSSSNNNQKKQTQSTQNATRNIVSRVAGTAVSAVVGAVVVVTTYETVQENEQEKDRTPIVESVNWEWNDETKEATAMFYDADGNLLKMSESTITVKRVAPTCTKEGSYIYTATVNEFDQEYSDTMEEKIPALGHDFDEEHIETLDDGTIVVECSRCHETFSIEIIYEEK